jgi:hypothetical protein
MSDKRNKLLVDSAFQGRLILRLVMYWIVYHVAMWHTLFLFNLFSTAISYDPAAPPKSVWELYSEFAGQHVGVLVCCAAMLPILARDLLKFSHRMAGPLVRFREAIEEMAAGKPIRPVTLRPRDLLDEFLVAFNKMVATWNQQVGQERAAAPVDSELELVRANR